jgi:hypothetical protein
VLTGFPARSSSATIAASLSVLSSYDRLSTTTCSGTTVMS